MLESSSLQASDIKAIGIAIGPGAFTGLRAGFGVAKGFHLATGAPLIGVSTLEATALPHALCGLPIVAVVAAGRGRLVWAHYNAAAIHLQETRPPRNGTPSELAGELAEFTKVIVTGEFAPDQASTIAAAPAAVIPLPAVRGRQPAAFAELAWQRFRNGQVDDAELLEPIYLSR